MKEERAEISTYVVGDIHGHLDALIDALRAHGFVDDDEDWVGGESRLWFVGDFVDRGPDGIGVIDLVMRLQAQAADVGGEVETLLGNHEILLLGVHKFGDTEVKATLGAPSFARSWEINGGQRPDKEALTKKHVDWLKARPLLAHVADHLLMHSDTLEYLEWGAAIDEINSAVHDILDGDELADWWEIWRRMTTRFAFRGSHGPEAADMLLDQLGGECIVHGHTVIADQLGVPPFRIDQPIRYADDKVLGVDGGLFAGGPCLIVPLPWVESD